MTIVLKFAARCISIWLAAFSLICPADAAAETANCGSLCDVRMQADSFLRNMPEKLQAHQAEAIRRAIAGDAGMLTTVRQSRNKIAELPTGVYRTEVGNGLALFRSTHYDSDTIPLLVYLHGGGWVIGSINSCSRYCGVIADKGVAVLAVDYRLAPENPFPEGLDDCIAAVGFAMDKMAEWKCRGISIGGDSSGGNLAIATALSFPENTFTSLVTFYPVTKAYADDSASWEKYGEGFGLDSKLMEAFNQAYTDDCRNVLVSPAEADDVTLMKLPPMLMVAAERDILRDQGQEFVNRLKHLGKDVCYVVIPGSVHLFITVDGQPSAFSRSVEESAAFILNRP